jgi:hypothetical protein
MDEDTRKLILRIQSEDLAELWTTSADNSCEIDATLRVYRRQLKLLDRHLENARQARTIEATGEGAGHDTATTALQILDTDVLILTEDGDVQRVGVDYSRLESPILQIGGINLRRKPSFLKTPVVSTIPIYSCSSAQPQQASDRPVVRLPPLKSMATQQLDMLTRNKSQAATRGQTAEEAREEVDRKEETRKKVSVSRNAAGKLTQHQPFSSHTQPVKEMSIHDILDTFDRKQVERMMTVLPDKAVEVLYEALQACHGSFDNALDMIFRQEVDDVDMDSVNLADSAIESRTAHSNALSRSAFIQSIKDSTHAIADNYSTKLKPFDPSFLAVVYRKSILASTELSTTETKSLKRSADHFEPPAGPSSKKHTSVTIKKESDEEPAQPATKGTIRNQVEDLLQSARLLSSPTTRVGNLASRHDYRGMSGAPPPPPPSHRQDNDTRFNGQHPGSKARAVPSGPPPPSILRSTFRS